MLPRPPVPRPSAPGFRACTPEAPARGPGHRHCCRRRCPSQNRPPPGPPRPGVRMVLLGMGGRPGREHRRHRGCFRPLKVAGRPGAGAGGRRAPLRPGPPASRSLVFRSSSCSWSIISCIQAGRAVYLIGYVRGLKAVYVAPSRATRRIVLGQCVKGGGSPPHRPAARCDSPEPPRGASRGLPARRPERRDLGPGGAGLPG